jgi:CxxC motif-containing protein
MEKRDLTCIGCPMGCQITVELEKKEDGEIEVLSVKGNTCAIGDRYARNEVAHPERTVTSTIVVAGGKLHRASVKTNANIPKDKIFACMEAIDKVAVKAPVAIGDVVIADVCGTGVDVIVTKNCEIA